MQIVDDLEQILEQRRRAKGHQPALQGTMSAVAVADAEISATARRGRGGALSARSGRMRRAVKKGEPVELAGSMYTDR